MYRVGKTRFTIYKTSLHDQSSANINHNCVNDYPYQGNAPFWVIYLISAAQEAMDCPLMVPRAWH